MCVCVGDLRVLGMDDFQEISKHKPNRGMWKCFVRRAKEQLFDREFRVLNRFQSFSMVFTLFIGSR